MTLKLKSVLPMIAIIGIMWVLVLVGSVLIFYFVVPLEIPALGKTATGALKVVVSLVLGILWLFIFIRLRDSFASSLFK